MRLRLTIIVMALTLLAGCSKMDVPDAKSTTGRTPLVAEVPNAEETVRGADDPPIVTLRMRTQLRERRLAKTDNLPGNIIVPTTNLTAVPVTDALQAVLAGTDVSLSWDTGGFENKLVSVTNLSGSLPKVVDKICASAKIFCSFRSGLLEMKEKETFVIDLPTMPTTSSSGKSSSTSGSSSSSISTTAANTMAETIGELAGEKARIDSQGGNLLFTTDVDGYEKVKEYLVQLRHGRPLVIMQLYIWEVVLNKNDGTGINWSSFSFPKIGGNFENMLLSGSTAFSSLSSPGVSLGATMAGRVSATAVLQFLSTQGQVQTISNPQLTFVSGSSAEFRVGGKQRYISQVGQLTTNSVSGSTTNNSSSSVGSNTISTDSIETGLTINVGGGYESGVINAVLNLEIQDVVSLNPTTMSTGVVIDLPETSERKVSTSLRVRPGDNLVLAGLVSSRDINDRDGINFFGGRIPAYAQDELKNSELVILVKPSIVLFSEAEDEAPAKKPAIPAASSSAEQLPSEALVIDKDGAKILSPAAKAAPAAASAVTPSAQPVTGVRPATYLSLPPDYQEQQSSASNIKDEVAPASAGVYAQDSTPAPPVDGRLMQRGFSHAYDELLAPTPLSSAYSSEGSQ